MAQTVAVIAAMSLLAVVWGDCPSGCVPAPQQNYSWWGGNFGCGGDVECVNCTPAQAQAKCGGGPIFVETYDTNVTCARTRGIGPPATFIGNFSCCSQLLGPTTYNLTNCFFCPGDADCVQSGSDKGFVRGFGAEREIFVSRYR